jgi:hypothetical protein
VDSAVHPLVWARPGCRKGRSNADYSHNQANNAVSQPGTALLNAPGTCARSDIDGPCTTTPGPAACEPTTTQLLAGTPERFDWLSPGQLLEQECHHPLAAHSYCNEYYWNSSTRAAGPTWGRRSAGTFTAHADLSMEACAGAATGSAVLLIEAPAFSSDIQRKSKLTKHAQTTLA